MTMEPAEAARLRQAFAATSPTDAPRADCPPAETLWEGLHGELGHAELCDLLRHIAVCPVCTEAWRLGMELDVENPDEEPVEKPVLLPSAGWSLASWARPLAAAAMVVLAVGVAFWPEAPATRSGAGGIELVTGEELSRADPQVAWARVEGATSYRLEIWTLDGDVKVHEAPDLELPEARVPPRVLVDLPPGTELLIRIEAFRDGEPLAARRVFPVRIR